MRPLSLDLRGGPVEVALTQPNGTGAAGVSFLVHAVGITALVLVPLLRAAAPPKPANAALEPLVTPVRVVLPPAAPERPRAERRPAPPQRATRPAAAIFEVPKDVPTSIVHSDDLLDIDFGPSVPGLLPGPGDPSLARACALGALCGDAPLPVAEPLQRQPVRVGGIIAEPRLIDARAPQYPPVAQATGVSGKVVIEAHVGPDGRVRECRVLEGHPLFDEAALASVRTRRYQPLKLNDVPTDFLVTITVAFSIRR